MVSKINHVILSLLLQQLQSEPNSGSPAVAYILLGGKLHEFWKIEQGNNRWDARIDLGFRKPGNYFGGE